MADSQDAPLQKTALHALHQELGAKMVPFAGYDMPVQYPAGILSEHLHCRAEAGLFDVSHMGQVRLIGADAARALETLVPGDMQGLAQGRIRYTLFTDDAGGILDDLMASRTEDGLFLVVNAACKAQDIAHLRKHLSNLCKIEVLEGQALLALQGPKAAAVLARFDARAAAMPFMSFAVLNLAGISVTASRSGYTGEDGYEISVANQDAQRLARLLLEQSEVKPVGLGARDSLRLEAGLCLYGSDIDKTTTPIEANLAWTIAKRRREQGGFPGAARILAQLREGISRLRVGVQPLERAPARAHTEITDADGRKIGEITSGGFGPSCDAPVAMGYVETQYAKIGTDVRLLVRGTPRPAKICALPFAAHRYFKG